MLKRINQFVFYMLFVFHVIFFHMNKFITSVNTHVKKIIIIRIKYAGMNRCWSGLLIIIIVSPFPLTYLYLANVFTYACNYICMFQIKMMPFYNLHDVSLSKTYTYAGLFRIIWRSPGLFNDFDIFLTSKTYRNR